MMFITDLFPVKIIFGEFSHVLSASIQNNGNDFINARNWITTNYMYYKV